MSKAKPITTVSDLARMVERSRKTVRQWLRRDDWTFNRKPPWSAADVPAMLRWSADNLRENRNWLDDEDERSTRLDPVAAVKQTVEMIVGKPYAEWVAEAADDLRRRADEWERNHA